MDGNHISAKCEMGDKILRGSICCLPIYLDKGISWCLPSYTDPMPKGSGQYVGSRLPLNFDTLLLALPFANCHSTSKGGVWGAETMCVKCLGCKCLLVLDKHSEKLICTNICIIT